MPPFNYKFDTIPDRSGTNTIKFDTRIEVFGRADVIPLWIADMDFEVAPPITEAIRERSRFEVYGYDLCSEASGPSLRRWLERRAGWRVEADWLRFTPGVVTGLGFAIRAFTAPGDGILIQPPVYAPFRMMTESNGRCVVNNPLRRTGDGFAIDFDDLDCRLRDARAMILCNPHNPVGRVFTEDELRRVGELCVRHDVIIISDEIHSDLVFSPHRHLHIASLDPRFAERTVTFVAPSKSFNIAGLMTSAAVIGSERLRRMWDHEYGKIYFAGGTVFGHAAMRAAYDSCEDWLEEVLVYLAGNIDYVRRFLAEHVPEVKTVRQEGTYLMWLDFRGLGMPHDELMKWLVFEAGLGLNDGADFGPGGEGHARLNAATNRATLERAMSQLAEAAGRLKKRG